MTQQFWRYQRLPTRRRGRSPVFETFLHWYDKKKIAMRSRDTGTIFFLHHCKGITQDPEWFCSIHPPNHPPPPHTYTILICHCPLGQQGGWGIGLRHWFVHPRLSKLVGHYPSPGVSVMTSLCLMLGDLFSPKEVTPLGLAPTPRYPTPLVTQEWVICLGWIGRMSLLSCLYSSSLHGGGWGRGICTVVRRVPGPLYGVRGGTVVRGKKYL